MNVTAELRKPALDRRFCNCISNGEHLPLRIPTAGVPLFRLDARSPKFEIANPERSSDNFKSIGSRVFCDAQSMFRNLKGCLKQNTILCGCKLLGCLSGLFYVMRLV